MPRRSGPPGRAYRPQTASGIDRMPCARSRCPAGTWHTEVPRPCTPTLPSRAVQLSASKAVQRQYQGTVLLARDHYSRPLTGLPLDLPSNHLLFRRAVPTFNSLPAVKRGGACRFASPFHTAFPKPRAGSGARHSSPADSRHPTTNTENARLRGTEETKRSVGAQSAIRGGGGKR